MYELCEEEKKRRKQLKLPTTKPLQYLNGNEKIEVIGFDIDETLFPSGSHILRIALANGEERKVHEAYFLEMQKG